VNALRQSCEFSGGYVATRSSPAAADVPILPRLIFAREPDWHFSLMLALEVVFLFAAIPALSQGGADRDVVRFLQLALAGITIALIAKSTWVRIGLGASFGLTLLASLLPYRLPFGAVLGMGFVYNFLVTAVTARAVFGRGEVNHHRIAGAVFVYLNIALVFAIAYSGLRALDPNALAGFAPDAPVRLSEMVHFSFTTLTTIGDGTIMPQSPFARSLSDMETVIGHLFPAILLSRLVGLHLSKSQ